MTAEEYLKWYEEILSKFDHMPRHQSPFHRTPVPCYTDQPVFAWAAAAETALATVFAPGHPFRQNWARLTPKLRPSEAHGGSLHQLAGVFLAATDLLRAGRLGSLRDAVRAETEDELLDQALQLVVGGYIAASAVIAGGALESHLRHLVEKNELPINGEGSIAKYDSAVAMARNEGTATIFTQTDSKLITGWGGIRNDAAHKPAEFNRSTDDVRRMIEGIRGFISRTS